MCTRGIRTVRHHAYTKHTSCIQKQHHAYKKHTACVQEQHHAYMSIQHVYKNHIMHTKSIHHLDKNNIMHTRSTHVPPLHSTNLKSVPAPQPVVRAHGTPGRSVA